MADSTTAQFIENLRLKQTANALHVVTADAEGDFGEAIVVKDESGVFDAILKELRVMNMHLTVISGEHIEPGDL